MNKTKHFLAYLLVTALAITSISFSSGKKTAKAEVTITGQTQNIAYNQTPYGIHGNLEVKGGKLVDNKGTVMQLQGVSSHGINWDVGEPFVNEKALQNLRDEWGVNCFRIAMYTADYNGYCVTSSSSRKKLLRVIDRGVKAAKKLGMYVIIDWHILNDRTPKKYQKKAKKFFQIVAKKYKKYGNVMYELCNEPNGKTSWNTIKKYAKTITKVIRKYSKQSIVIVGTPTWSQDVDKAAKSPLSGKNIMYSFHFYAATHKDYNRQKVQVAINRKLPVICTEFSGCDASGNGSIDEKSLNTWVSFMNKNDISYCCWSLSNKNETASLLKSSCKRTSGFTSSNLSKMGRWLVNTYHKN